MALRNISNTHLQQLQHNTHNNNNILMYKKTSNLFISNKNENNNNSNGSSGSGASSSSSNSIQIRTSSPISGAGSMSSGSSDAVIVSPSKFMQAVHQSRKQQKQNQQAAIAFSNQQNYISMKELAFEKLRKQQSIEKDLKEHFKLNQLNKSEKLKSTGKLKLSIYNNMNHLTLNIIEGRSYTYPNLNSHSQTYVKLTMLPDLDKRFKKLQTSSIRPSIYEKDSKDYLIYDYQSKYSFELQSDQHDYLRNRLIVSVWSAMNEEMIGCFSFKLKHLVKQTQPKPEWYHLLPLQYGLRKNIKCNNSSTKSTAKSTTSSTSSSNSNNKIIPTNINKNLINMEKIDLTLIKQNEQESFGFTLVGSCPCMIGKVEANRTAYKYGLKQGDYISKINNKNVSRATCESVVKLIKSCKFRLDLQVYRQKSSSSNLTNDKKVVKLNVQQQQQPLNNYYYYDNYNNNSNNSSTANSFSSISSSDYCAQNNFEILVPIPHLAPTASNSNTNLNKLEVVLEEDEEDLVEELEEEESESENEQEKEDQISTCRIRHVDSSEISNEEDNYYNDANTLRRVAAQFYNNNNLNSNNNKVNHISSLRNLKLN